MAESGLVVVDKPAGLTSHDVVARVRRLAGTRKVGHAGTLDPMATGVLIIGVGKATRLLGHLALTDKSYDATIRLGATTVTDDAEGDVTTSPDQLGSPEHRDHVNDLTEAKVQVAVATFTGVIDQVPSAVSAIKVDGVRSYARVRKGEFVALAPRQVTVTTFDVCASRLVEAVATAGDVAVEPRPEISYLALDVDVSVTCSTGTYIRALARDLGAALGVGGHLTALRRTRVGSYGLDTARTLDELAESFEVVPLRKAVADSFRCIDVTEDEASRIRNGVRLPWPPQVSQVGPVGVFAPDGDVLALAEPYPGDLMSYLAVLA